MSADLVVIADALHGTDGEVLAVSGGRIAAVGDRDDARTWTGAGTEVLRIPGTVLPGLVDAHSHPVLGARVSRGMDLQGIRSPAELRAAVAAERQRLAPGGWILGWGLAHSVWAGAPITADALGDAADGAPVLLRMFDAHSALANTVALERAGIAAGRAFPSGARVEADAAGRPTGFLQEHEAIDLVEHVVPPESEADVAARLAHGLAAMAAAGLTGTHVMDFEGDPTGLYRAVEDAGLLPLRLRIHPWVLPESAPDDWARLIAATGRGGTLWRRHGVKFFLDGTIDNGTAWLRAPDCHGESTRSVWSDPERYGEAVARFAAAGVPTATHAIGDEAVLWAAETIAATRNEYPLSLHRIEHLELTGDDIVRAVAGSGAVASMQPTHCTRFVSADGSDNWSARLGRPRTAHAWRTRSLADLGVTLALGSDWPIAPFDPREILAEAQTRRSGGEPVLPSEGLTAAQALAGYTRGAAVAAGTAREEGAIAIGMRADLTVLGADPERLPAEELPGIPVHATVVDGIVRHRAV